MIRNWRSNPLQGRWLRDPFPERRAGTPTKKPSVGGLEQLWCKASTIVMLASSRRASNSGGLVVGPRPCERLQALGVEKIIDS